LLGRIIGNSKSIIDWSLQITSFLIVKNTPQNNIGGIIMLKIFPQISNMLNSYMHWSYATTKLDWFNKLKPVWA